MSCARPRQQVCRSSHRSRNCDLIADRNLKNSHTPLLPDNADGRLMEQQQQQPTSLRLSWLQRGNRESDKGHLPSAEFNVSMTYGALNVYHSSAVGVLL